MGEIKWINVDNFFCSISLKDTYRLYISSDVIRSHLKEVKYIRLGVNNKDKLLYI